MRSRTPPANQQVLGSRQVRLTCSLPDNVDPSAVTAVAVVTNDTPPPTPAQPANDESGDAHRVQPYAQGADLDRDRPFVSERGPQRRLLAL